MSSPPGAALEPHCDLTALLAACEAARDGGDHVGGERTAREAHAVAFAAGDRAGAARAAVLLALHLFRQGKSDDTVQQGRAALPQVDADGRPEWSIELRNTLTLACNEIGLPNEALSYAVDALHRAHQLGSAPLVSWSLNRLGTTYETMGNFDRALEYLQQAAEVADECGEIEVRFAAHVNMAVTYMQRVRTSGHDVDPAGRVNDARLALQAIARATELCGTHPHQRMYCCGIECSALLAAGELDAMRIAVDRYKELARRHGLSCFVQLGLLYEADWLVDSGRAEQACRQLHERVDERELRDHPNWMRWLLDLRHRANKACGRTAPALAAMEALLALERREARQRLDAQTRLLMRELEVQNARHEAQRLRQRASELEARAAAAASAALEDPLTGLANRRALDLRLAELLPQHSGARSALCAAMIDIDHFKAINDGYGHATGDSVLRELARLLRERTRAGDLVTRCGGEEFVLVLAGAAATAAEVCERVRVHIERHRWATIAPGLAVTISLGLATAGSADDAASLLARADGALYAAKRGGRNRLVVA